jgi:hypothetical protein
VKIVTLKVTPVFKYLRRFAGQITSYPGCVEAVAFELTYVAQLIFLFGFSRGILLASVDVCFVSELSFI